MAKNLGADFATMDDDERRRFAQGKRDREDGGIADADDAPQELDFPADGPRDFERKDPPPRT